MVGDMKQETGENSDAYQAKRDINITNEGMDYRNVKQLCLDLIHENFPKLQAEAMHQVNANVMTFTNELKNEIAKKHATINTEKLAQPDVQAALNEAVQGAAKKGKKADINLLANLVASRIDKGNSDLLDITIEEAIRLTTKLTKDHINFLSVKHFISSMTIHVPNVVFMQLEQFAAPVLESFGSHCVLSIPNIQYLGGVGVLDFNPMLAGLGPYDIQFKAYPSLASNTQEFKEKVKTQAPSLNKLLKIYEKEKFASTRLNSFGKVIALTNLDRLFGGIDLKIWIN